MRLTKTGLMLLLTLLWALIIIMFFIATQPAKAQEVVVTPLPSPGFSLPERAAAIVGGCTAGATAIGVAAGLALTPLTAPIAIVTILGCAIVADTELPG